MARCDRDCKWCTYDDKHQFFQDIFIDKNGDGDGEDFLDCLECMLGDADEFSDFEDNVDENALEDPDELVYFLHTQILPSQLRVYKIGKIGKGEKKNNKSLLTRSLPPASLLSLFGVNRPRYNTYLWSPTWISIFKTSNPGDLEGKIHDLLHRASWLAFPLGGGRGPRRELFATVHELDADFFKVICLMARGIFGNIPSPALPASYIPGILPNFATPHVPIWVPKPSPIPSTTPSKPDLVRSFLTFT